MSGKMLKRIINSKKHCAKLLRASEERRIQRKMFFQEAKRKYNKIWISNYPLLSAMFLLVAVACWATSSPFIFLLSIAWFYVLMMTHHRERIGKDEAQFLSAHDYQFASAVMNVCSVVGVVTTIGLLTAIYVFN